MSRKGPNLGGAAGLSGQAALEPSQRLVGEDGQQGGGNGSGEDDLVVDHGETAEDVFPEASGADGGGDGGEPDGNDSGHADAGDDDTQRQREFDAQKELAVGHAHAASGFDHSAVDACDSGRGVANQREQRVEGEGEDGEAVRAGADPGGGQKESEQGETGDGLNDVGAAEDGLAQHRMARDENAERDADEHRKKDGRCHQPQVLERKLQYFDVILRDEFEDIHWRFLQKNPNPATAKRAQKGRKDL